MAATSKEHNVGIHHLTIVKGAKAISEPTQNMKIRTMTTRIIARPTENL